MPHLYFLEILKFLFHYFFDFWVNRFLDFGSPDSHDFRRFGRGGCSGATLEPLGAPDGCSGSTSEPLGAQDGCSGSTLEPLGAQDGCSGATLAPPGTQKRRSGVSSEPLGAAQSLLALEACIQRGCSKRLFKNAVRRGCSKELSLLTLSSASLRSVPLCSVHGYARVHTSIYIYIYIYI